MISIFTQFIRLQIIRQKRISEASNSFIKNFPITNSAFNTFQIVPLFIHSNNSKPKLIMKKIFTLIILLLAVGQLVTAQTTTSKIVSWQDMVAYEAAHPELLKTCKTCPNKEADNEWREIVTANMPVPAGAIIKTQEGKNNSNVTNRPPGPILMAPSRPPLQNWLAHLDIGNIIPPDTHGAVGLNHVITATNNFVKIHNKVGGAQISQVTISTFTGIGSTCDPYMVFDPTAQRWIFSSIECTTNGNRVILMTSNTADPTGTWREITWVPAGNIFLDHPYVGFDNNMIVVSGRRFPSGFAGPSLYLVDKAAMYAGTAITFGTNAQTIDKTAADGDAPCPVTVYEPPFSTVGNPTPGTFYILQSWNGSASSIRLSTVTGAIPAASWNTTTAVFPSGGTAWNSGNLPNSVQQTVETRLLAANDARISSAVMMNGKIWCAHHIAFPASGQPDRIAVQWWQLDGAAATLGNVIQRGRVGGTVAGEYKWFPGIVVNKDEDMLVGYSASSTTSRVNAAYITRQAATPANTNDDELIYHAGEDRYWKDFGSGRARWGDYSHSALDPVDNSLWTIQEYAAPGAGTIPPDNNSRFGMWWAQVPRSNSPAAPVITAGTATITAESCAPANGAIDPNETVTINFCLQNVGTGNTTNLVGTLLATGGVTAPSGPQTYGVVVAGGAAVCKTFSFTANTACGGTLTASIQLQDGATSLGTLTYNFVTGAISTVFTQNFDAVTAPALPAGWVATNASGPAPLWVTSNAASVSAPNSIFVDDPGSISDKIIETPTIAIASAGTSLSFRNNYNLESTFDGGVLEISINGGAYQDIITAGGVFTAGGYNGTISSAFGNPLANRSAWTGNAGSFLVSTVTLPPAAAGQNIKLRFRMGSDNSVAAIGWRIDDVSISGRACCAVCVPPSVSTQPSNTSVCPTGNATFTIVAGGTAPFTYQWQESTGGPFANVTNGGIYSGATTASLTLTGVTAGMNGYQYRCVVTGNCGSPATSNAATLTVVASTVGGTVTPANSVVCTTPNTGTLTLSGHTGAVIRWESATNIAGPYTPIANTTTTLTFNNLTVTTYFRAVVQAAGCVAANSSIATVTANTNPLVIIAVPGSTLCEGDPAALTVYESSGFAPVALTQSSSNAIVAGSVACNAGGLHTDNSYFRAYNLAPLGLPSPLTINTVTFGIEQAAGGAQPVTVNLYTQNAGPAFPGGTRTLVGTQNFTIPNQTLSLFTGTFTTPATVPNNAVLIVELFTPSGQATGRSFFIGSNALPQTGPSYIMAAACGVPNPVDLASLGFPNMHIVLNVAGTTAGSFLPLTTGTFLWSPAAGLSSTTTNPVAASPMNTTTYTVVHNDGAGCVRSANITITVNKRPVVTTQPVNSTNCSGTSATFTVAGTGTNLTYQWQESTTGPGGPWNNLANGAPYSGVNTTTLTINPVSVTMNNNRYRCVLSGTCPAIGTANISTSAILTVNPLPVILLTPTGPVCGGVPGINGTLIVAGSAPPPVPGTVTVSSGPISVIVPDNTPAGATHTLAVSTVPANATLTNVHVTWTMPHTWDGDMVFALKAPNGQILNLDYLLSITGGTGATTGFVNTTVSSAGVNALSSGSNPYTGTFKADAVITNVNAGPGGPTGFTPTVTTWPPLYTTANGNWVLAMKDGFAGDQGTLTSWSIKFDYTTPGSTGAPLTYTWSPAAGLYTNPTATIPYVAGSQTDRVYAAPSVFTAYTVTGTDTNTGCTNTGVVLVNYTPPAPAVTPSSVTMCLGDPAVRLTSSSSTTSNVTFSSGPISVAVPDFNVNGIVTTLASSGIPAGANISAIKVTWNMTHTWNGDMVFALKAPNGNILNLDYYLSSTGGAGATTGFVNTAVSSTGVAALSSGTGTYTGTFKADAIVGAGAFGPSGPTGYAPTGNTWTQLYSVPNGTWTLAMYDGGPADVGTLTSWSIQITYVQGVPATPAVWTPNGVGSGLFTDPAASIAYTGTPTDTVYTRPTPAGVYPYQVTVQSLPAPPATVATPMGGSNGNFLIAFNVRNNNGYPVTFERISGNSFGSGAIVSRVFFKPSPIAGNPGPISAANGWTQFGTANNTVTASTLNLLMTGLTLVIPPGATYGIALDFTGATFNRYTNGTGAIQTYSAGGCDIITDGNVGWGGPAAPGTPANNPRNFNGAIGFVASFPACTSPARTVIVTVNQPTTITTQPVNQTICTDKVATFTVAAAGTGPFSYQWQVSSNNGNTYTNITNGGVYSGATTATLTITAPPVSMSGYYYRCIVTGAAPCAPVTSFQVILTVNPLPTIVISASPYTSLFPGLRTTLTSTVTPNAAATYTWLRDGVAVAGATTGTLVRDVDGLGVYQLRVTDVNGCTNTSNSITIKDSASGRCFIYPNPNSGQFQVRYYSVANNVLPRSLTIYDAKGDRVFTQFYTIGRPYDRMDVDMRAYGKGLYWVEIGDMNGNRLTMCRIVIQ